MADKKENNPSALGGPTADASTTKSTSDSKQPMSILKMKNQESFAYNAHDDLDDVVMGGCSTCGSLQHDTVKCDRKDVQPEFMMSGALQTEEDSSTSASASATASSTTAPAEKGGQAQSGMPSGQDAGRRRSV